MTAGAVLRYLHPTSTSEQDRSTSRATNPRGFDRLLEGKRTRNFAADRKKDEGFRMHLKADLQSQRSTTISAQGQNRINPTCHSNAVAAPVSYTHLRAHETR